MIHPKALKTCFISNSKVPIVISNIFNLILITYSVLGLAPNLLEGKERKERKAKSAKGCFRDFYELI